jgi:phosphoribosylformylglycinamidine synthase
MKYIVEVSLKSNFIDHHGEHIRHDMAALGIKGIPRVRSRQLYSIEGGVSTAEIKAITEKLLIDPITEDYGIVSEAEKERKPSIEVWLKQGVTDTVAESVAKAVRDLGIRTNLEMKTGQKYIFEGKISPAQLKHAAEKMLANPIIQSYLIN